MKKAILLIFICSTIQLFSQVEIMPTFPGGNNKLFEYVMKNFNYSAISRSNNISGQILTTFIIDSTGAVIEPKIIRGLDQESNREAIRLLSSMPNWTRGKQNGENVRVQYNLPILVRPKTPILENEYWFKKGNEEFEQENYLESNISFEKLIEVYDNKELKYKLGYSKIMISDIENGCKLLKMILDHSNSEEIYNQNCK